MLSRSRYSRDGHDWNSVSDMQLGSLCGGFLFLEGGSQKGGFGRTPEPPGYGPVFNNVLTLSRFIVVVAHHATTALLSLH